MPNYITHGLVYKKEQVNKQAVKIWREKTDLKLACTGGCCRSAVWRPCGVTLHAALQNKSVVCSGSRVTNSTVMKLHESDNRGGIAVKTYKEHLLTYINIYIWHLALVQRYWREAVGVKLLLLLLLIAFIQRYSPLSSRLTALACDSTWVNSFL